MEEEKKIESEEPEKKATVTFDLGIVAFFTALGSVALNLLFTFIIWCGATGVGVARAFGIIEVIVFVAAVTFYVIPMFKDRKVKLDGTLVLLLVSALTLLKLFQ